MLGHQMHIPGWCAESSSHMRISAGMQGACQQEVATTVPRRANQCVITLTQPLLNHVGAASPLVLLNVYARALEVSSNIIASEQQRGGAIISQAAGSMWLANVTLEGSKQSFTAEGNTLLVSASNATNAVNVSATECTFTGVTGGAGAAVKLDANATGPGVPLVTASLSNCTVRDNSVTTDSGGAVQVGSGAALRLSQCTFQGNVGEDLSADNADTVWSEIFVC